jgi:hypothetical protein
VAGTACCRPLAATVAVLILFAACFDLPSLLLSKISAVVRGANWGSFARPGEEERLSGGVEVSVLPQSFASSLYCVESGQHISRLASHKWVAGKQQGGQSQFEKPSPRKATDLELMDLFIIGDGIRMYHRQESQHTCSRAVASFLSNS